MGIFSRMGDIIKSNITDWRNGGKSAEEILYKMRLKLDELNKQACELSENVERAGAAVKKNRSDYERFRVCRSKAEAAGNTGDVQVFDEKLKRLEQERMRLEAGYRTAYENCEKLKDAHDRLALEIIEAESRLKNIDALNSAAEANELLNESTFGYGDAGKLSNMLDCMETEADIRNETAEYLNGKKEDKND